MHEHTSEVSYLHDDCPGQQLWGLFSLLPSRTRGVLPVVPAGQHGRKVGGWSRDLHGPCQEVARPLLPSGHEVTEPQSTARRLGL